MRISNLKIGTRLNIAFAALIVIMLIVAAVRTRSAATQIDTMFRTVDVDVKYAVHVFEARIALADLRRHEKDLLLSLASPQEVDSSIKLWRATRGRAQAQLKAAQALAQGAARDNLARLEEALGVYASAIDVVHADIVAGKIASPADGNRALAASTATVQAADRTLEEMHLAAVKQVDEVKPVLTANETQRRINVLTGVVVVISLAALIVWFTTRTIVRPLQGAVTAAGRIAQGDLTVEFQSTGRDETAELQRALQAMVQNLRQLVGEVRLSTHSVSSAAREMAQG